MGATDATVVSVLTEVDGLREGKAEQWQTYLSPPPSLDLRVFSQLGALTKGYTLCRWRACY